MPEPRLCADCGCQTTRSARVFNPNEEIMGSTPYGSADPISAFGAGLPPHIEIDRAGGSRASVGGQA